MKKIFLDDKSIDKEYMGTDFKDITKEEE